jgi:hypothetical protein
MMTFFRRLSTTESMVYLAYFVLWIVLSMIVVLPTTGTTSFWASVILGLFTTYTLTTFITSSC